MYCGGSFELMLFSGGGSVHEWPAWTSESADWLVPIRTCAAVAAVAVCQVNAAVVVGSASDPAPPRPIRGRIGSAPPLSFASSLARAVKPRVSGMSTEKEHPFGVYESVVGPAPSSPASVPPSSPAAGEPPELDEQADASANASARSEAAATAAGAGTRIAGILACQSVFCSTG